MAADVNRLIADLRAALAPEALYPLAATANGLLAANDAPGPLLVAHLSLMAIARRVDGEALSEGDWRSIRQLLAILADFLADPSIAMLDEFGHAWRAWTQPAALH